MTKFSPVPFHGLLYFQSWQAQSTKFCTFRSKFIPRSFLLPIDCDINEKLLVFSLLEISINLLVFKISMKGLGILTVNRCKILQLVVNFLTIFCQNYGWSTAGTDPWLKTINTTHVTLLGLCRLFISLNKVSFGKVWQARL